MNPLGVHALVWVGDWSDKSAQFAIESTKEVGFDVIELALLDPSATDIAMTKQLLDDNGLGVTASLGLDDDADVSSEDPAVVARGRDRLAAALEVAHGIGATHLCGVLYSALRKYPHPASELSRQNSVAAMAWLAEQCSAAGVKLSLEVVNRYETNIANTAEEMLDFIDQTGADIGVHLDSYHMNIEENGLVEPVQQTGSRLGYVHIGESHRGYLGTGNVDFDSLFGAIRDSDYDGPVTFESFSSAVVHPSLSNTLAVWRNLWEDGRDLATHAHAFMAERLAPR
ncbi:MAG: D-psicose/D-tagatose/L-ribulose 3-epimerase [Actinomycetota bacterium]|jgi:D-psicose/D-tagatose/L-ribulose 3-epimerase|nr:D-psicose/D-tagatose/L-ribulose 3-epimerase [Actinomycetota bacterium]